MFPKCDLYNFSESKQHLLFLSLSCACDQYGQQLFSVEKHSRCFRAHCTYTHSTVLMKNCFSQFLNIKKKHFSIIFPLYLPFCGRMNFFKILTLGNRLKFACCLNNLSNSLSKVCISLPTVQFSRFETRFLSLTEKTRVRGLFPRRVFPPRVESNNLQQRGPMLHHDHENVHIFGVLLGILPNITLKTRVLKFSPSICSTPNAGKHFP